MQIPGSTAYCRRTALSVRQGVRQGGAGLRGQGSGRCFVTQAAPFGGPGLAADVFPVYGGAKHTMRPETAMKAAVITFPGSNCDRDLATAFEKAGYEVARIWHKDSELPQGVDVVGVPGGFSHGDYLRCGAIAARAPVMDAVRAHAARGGYVLGICNGFQILTESGLLPGALMRNTGLKYICRTIGLTVTAESAFTAGYKVGEQIALPIAHHDGNFQADAETIARLKGDGRVAFTYTDNPNGAAADIAGILSENRRVLGMMPHPERAADPMVGNTDGQAMFRALAGAMALA